MGTSTITFHRPPAVWRDRLRSYRLVIDGSVRAKIRPGETVRIPVTPGSHRVEAKIDWTGSPALIIALPEGSEARLRIEPSGNTWMALAQMFEATGYLRLTVEGITALPVGSQHPRATA